MRQRDKEVFLELPNNSIGNLRNTIELMDHGKFTYLNISIGETRCGILERPIQLFLSDPRRIRKLRKLCDVALQNLEE